MKYVFPALPSEEAIRESIQAPCLKDLLMDEKVIATALRKRMDDYDFERKRLADHQIENGYYAEVLKTEVITTYERLRQVRKEIRAYFAKPLG